jgi:hypothetical protein
MTLRISILVISIYMLLPFTGFSQQHCATDYIHQQQLKKDTAYARAYRRSLDQLDQAVTRMRLSSISGTDSIFTIPVVVHIVHNNAAGTIGGPNNVNISDEQIASQIKVLNEDYRRLNADSILTRALFKPDAADAKFQFCLANRDPNGNFTTGITRTYSSKSYFDVSGPDEFVLKALAYWPNDQYLNIWVGKIESFSGTILGYTHYPVGSGLPGLAAYSSPDSLDGVVIDFRAFGNTGTLYNYYKKGRTTTHEIGHFFGLFHLWGDGNSNCGNDFCGDTPIDKNPNVDTDCLDSSNCTGPFTIDQLENYMDYSPDACMNMFSKDQVLRMRSAALVSPKRKALLNSPGCCGDCMDETASLPFFEGFENIAFNNSGWTISNPDSLNTWTRTNPGATSSFSYYIKNDSSYTSSPPGDIYYDFLTTPFINFSNTTSPNIEFDLAYAKASNLNLDSLILSYNILCDTIWTPVLTLSGNQLPTTPTIQDMFVPSPADWKRYKINVPAIANKRFVRFRFEDYSRRGNNLYIDNIHLYSTSENLQMNIFPNPSSSEINVEVTIPSESDVVIEVFDLLGRSLLKQTLTNTTSFLSVLNVSGLPEGMYLVRAIANNQKIVKKIRVSH